MTRGSRYPDMLRAEVSAALADGGEVGELARRYGIPARTLRDWRAALPAEVRREMTPKKRDELGELIADSLHEALDTLAVQCERLADPAAFHQQNAREAAMMHGKLWDRAFRMLCALSPDDTSPPESP